ncbi:MAG: terminase small subunit [Comamonas sp.]
MSTPDKKPKPAAKKAAKTAAKGRVAPKKREQPDERWQAFAREYVKDFNGTQAAIRAGYAERSAAMQASRLLTKDKVQEFVRQANARIVERAETDGAAVVRRLNDIYHADPRELVEIYVTCCRYCYGVGHDYQYTMGEYNAKREAWLDEGKAIEKFPEKGGLGYDARRPPYPECPECFGTGHERQVLKDTRNLSRRAALLFAGVKVAKGGGISVLMHNQLDVLEKLMRHHGQYLADNKQLAGASTVPGTFVVEFVDPPKRENDPLDQMEAGQKPGQAPDAVSHSASVRKKVVR